MKRQFAMYVTFFIWIAISILACKDNPDDVFTNYYKPMPASVENKSMDIFPNQYQLFAEKKYKEAEESFLDLPDSLFTQEAQFYLGQSIMGDQRYAEAHKVFLPFTLEDNEWKSHAQWFMSLCLMKKNLHDAAHSLEPIMNNASHAYADQAKRLFEEIH